MGMVLFNISRKITFPDIYRWTPELTGRVLLQTRCRKKLFRPKGLNDDDDEDDWETSFGLFR